MKTLLRIALLALLAFSLPALAAAPGTWTFHDAAKLRGYNASNLNWVAAGDTIKIALFTSTSNAATTSVNNYASLTNEVGTTNTGYTTGGITVATTWTGTSTVTFTTSGAAVWTAGSANLTARYAVIYDNTDTNKTVIAHLLLDSTPADVTVTNGNTLTVNAQTIGTLALIKFPNYFLAANDAVYCAAA